MNKSLSKSDQASLLWNKKKDYIKNVLEPSDKPKFDKLKENLMYLTIFKAGNPTTVNKSVTGITTFRNLSAAAVLANSFSFNDNNSGDYGYYIWGPSINLTSSKNLFTYSLSSTYSPTTSVIAYTPWTTNNNSGAIFSYTSFNSLIRGAYLQVIPENGNPRIFIKANSSSIDFDTGSLTSITWGKTTHYYTIYEGTPGTITLVIHTASILLYRKTYTFTVIDIGITSMQRYIQPALQNLGASTEASNVQLVETPQFIVNLIL